MHVVGQNLEFSHLEYFLIIIIIIIFVFELIFFSIVIKLRRMGGGGRGKEGEWMGKISICFRPKLWKP